MERKGSRSYRTLKELREFAEAVGKERGFNQATVQDLFQVLLEAYNSNTEGRLSIVKATSLAMQFCGIATEAIANELHL